MILAVARAADLRLFALAIALVQVGVIVRAYRWLILLKAVGARVPFRRAVYLYFVGSFFNTFLPTGFGGDVVRVIGIGEGATSEQAAGTAVVDRLTGFIVLFLLALVALPFSANLLTPRVALLVVVLAGGVFRAEDRAFYARIEVGVRAAAPGARLVRLGVPPVVGVALIGLDRVLGGSTPPDVEARLRAELTDGRLLVSRQVRPQPPRSLLQSLQRCRRRQSRCRIQ